MDRALAVERLRRLHTAQGAFNAGGADAALRELLALDIVWTVPGDNRIAGTYVGVEAVLGYFARRRALAARTFKMHPREVLVGEGDWVAALTDGTAVVDGVEHTWSTVGLYRFHGARLAACWLLPLDPQAFDRVWR